MQQTYTQIPQEESKTTVSARLRRDIDEFADSVRRSNPLLTRARAGELTPETVGRYLRGIHHLLRHTPIHLSLAEERARTLGHFELADYYAEKRAEEDGHDRWAQSDIRGISAKFGVSVHEEPIPAAKTIVRGNAETIERSPFFYLAYVLFAEYFMVVMGPEWLGALAENCGIPPSLMTAIGNHVELDQAHVLEGCAEIDSLVHWDQADALRLELRGMTERFAAFCEALC